MDPGLVDMADGNTLRISLAPMRRMSMECVTSASSVARPGRPSPLRVPDPTLDALGQARDLLACIDAAQAWARRPLQTALALADGLPSRAQALGMSTLALRTLVVACLEPDDDLPIDPYALVPRAGRPLVRDLQALAAALWTLRTRARAASRHVMQLALLAPPLVRRASRVALADARIRGPVDAVTDPSGDASTDDDDPRAITSAGLAQLPTRIKLRAARARSQLLSLPGHADELRRTLRFVVVPSSAQDREITARYDPVPVA